MYELKNTKLALNNSYDIIVVGGGPSGCTAAIASAREGAKTLLIEATGCLGGMGTSGLVPAWCPFSDKEKIIYRGLAEKIFKESKKGMDHVTDEMLDWVSIDPEKLKRIYDDMVVQAGVTVLFNTFIASVETDGNGTADVIIASNKSGLTAYQAKAYIDCTGDGDIAAWAGAEYHKNDDLQPATHCFVVSNVDYYAYRHSTGLHSSFQDSPVHKIAGSEKYPLVTSTHMCNNSIGATTIGFNAGHVWGVDGTNPQSVSNALITGRKIASQLTEGLREYHPKAFANAHLEMTAPLMGIRETRRIVGEYTFTIDDYLARRSFDDEIGRNCYYIDVHRSMAEKKDNLDYETRTHRYDKGESHGIPYRCLIPKGIKNILVAGRSISSDRMSQGSLRVMPACLVTGEAAGVAAGMVYKNVTVDVRDVDIYILREKLKCYGAYIM